MGKPEIPRLFGFKWSNYNSFHIHTLRYDFWFRNPLPLFLSVSTNNILKTYRGILHVILEREARSKSQLYSQSECWIFLLLLFVFYCWLLRVCKVRSKSLLVSILPATPSSTSGWLNSWTFKSDELGSGPPPSLPSWEASCPPSLSFSS